MLKETNFLVFQVLEAVVRVSVVTYKARNQIMIMMMIMIMKEKMMTSNKGIKNMIFWIQVQINQRIEVNYRD